MKRAIFILLTIFLLVVPVSADTMELESTYSRSVYRGANETYSVMHDGVGTTVSAYFDITVSTSARTASGYYYGIYRGGSTWNTTNLSLSTGTITNLSISLFGYSQDTGLGAQTLDVVSFNPASQTVYATGDYITTSWGTTVYGSQPQSFFTNEQYKTIYLDSDAYSLVNAEGLTTFGFRFDSDVTNTEPSWATNTISRAWFYKNDNVGKKPKLTIVFTPGGGGDPPVASFTKSKTLVVFPSTITFTDTSTESPDTWSWDMGDGRSAVTGSGTPTYQYLKRGLFKVILTATNDDGSDASDPQYVWVTGFPQLQTITPYRDPNISVSLETATFTSSRPLSEEETLKVLKNMYGV